MMHYYPEWVDLQRLDVDREIWPQGVGGDDPRDGSGEYGRECMENALALVGQLVKACGA